LKQCLDTTKKSGETAKFEQAEGILNEVKRWMTEVGFNTTKFLFKKKEVKVKMTACYDAMKERIGLSGESGDSYQSKEEFLQIYSPAENKIFDDARQYCQTKLMKATFGKSKKCLLLIDILLLTCVIRVGKEP
jgi:hypothetical protein